MKKTLLLLMLILSFASQARSNLSDYQVKKLIINDSISSYSGKCPCPYNLASNGSRCGGRSAYVLGVKKTRLFLLGALFVLFSLALFASGLLLIHVALFTYSSWSVQVKFLVALLLGCLEVFTACGILFYLFRVETWVKFSVINHVLKSFVKNEMGPLSSSRTSGQDN